MYSVQDLHLFSCLFSLTISTSSTFFIHSLISLSTNFFLHLQFEWSNCSFVTNDFSHSHSQLLVFQINTLLHTPFPINSLHSNMHLSSFQRCLLLQTLASSLHLHLHVSCHIICLVSFVLDWKLWYLNF